MGFQLSCTHHYIRMEKSAQICLEQRREALIFELDSHLTGFPEGY